MYNYLRTYIQDYHVRRKDKKLDFLVVHFFYKEPLYSIIS